MKSASICVLIAAFFGAFSNPVAAQLSVAHIKCVQYGQMICGSDGFNNNSYGGTYGFVISQGYNVPGDGGGGTFANMGFCGGAIIPNTGTIVKDTTLPTPYCFQRLDPNWGPKEFGAIGLNGGSTVTDDNAQLQAWLNAPQPHMGDADTYGTSVQLQCGPPDTTIQGPESLDGALFEIMAVPIHGGSTFSGNEVIDAEGNCRLNGVAINANGMTNGTASINTVVADGNHVTIDGFSVLENGYDNLVCSGKYLWVRDSYLKGAAHDNLNAGTGSGCGANDKFLSDIFQGAQGTNIVFDADETTFADGVIEGAQGAGLDLTNARKVSVTGMHIQGNGIGQPNNAAAGAGAGIIINNTNEVSICSNHFEGNGGSNGLASSHIYFAGQNDNIDLCGNVYAPQSLADVTFRPSYVYDTATGTVLTNSHFYESAPPQAAGAVYSANAALILPQLQVPHVVHSEFSGLILSNDTTNTDNTQVDITSGEASDSTNSAVIQLAQNNSLPTGGCTVDISSSGVGGLDTPPAVPSTTYFYFLIAGAFGANPACIASASPTAPTFPSSAGPYSLATSGSTISTSLPYLYNVVSVAGVQINDPITGVDVPASTYVKSVGTLTTYVVGATITTTGCTLMPPNCSSTVSVTTSLPATVAKQMAVSDVLGFSTCNGSNSAQGSMAKGGYTIVGPTSSSSFTLSPALTTNGVISNDCLTVSGGNTITLSNSASGVGLGNSVTIYNGLYRMIGALYTNSSTQVISFTQDNATFYLGNPVSGINTNITTSAAKYTVIGIPNGISVAALGRCVAPSSVSGHNILIFTPAISPNSPASFPTSPGYSIRTTSTLGEATTAYPYRLDTDTSAEIAAQADVTPATLQCMTDGWVFHRGG